MNNTGNNVVTGIFSNDEFGDIRTVIIDNEPWFVGKDVADALGYTNSRKAISDHVDEEDKGVTKRDTLGGKQELTIINESGLYALIFGSKLESAKRFKHWVTSEVLPAIRKTGAYAMPKQQSKATSVSNTVLPERDDWYSKVNLQIETVCKAYNVSRRSVHHIILSQISRFYDIDYAKLIYVQENGKLPDYPMDVVAYFPQLQREAENVVETLYAVVQRKMNRGGFELWNR